MKTFLRAAVVVLSVSLLGGCAQQKQNGAPAMLNNVCIMTGEALDATSPTVDYMGGQLGFCCDKCLGKWNAMDDKQKKAAFDARKK